MKLSPESRCNWTVSVTKIISHEIIKIPYRIVCTLAAESATHTDCDKC